MAKTSGVTQAPVAPAAPAETPPASGDTKSAGPKPADGDKGKDSKSSTGKEVAGYASAIGGAAIGGITATVDNEKKADKADEKAATDIMAREKDKQAKARADLKANRPPPPKYTPRPPQATLVASKNAGRNETTRKG